MNNTFFLRLILFYLLCIYRLRFKILFYLKLVLSIDKKIKESKVLFIHIPKNAGVSISSLLYKKQIGHKDLNFYAKKCKTLFDDYFVFTVVRDPVERFISAYNYLINGGSGNLYDSICKHYLLTFNDINDFIDQAKVSNNFSLITHFRTQTSFISHKNKIYKKIRIFNLEKVHELKIGKFDFSLLPKLNQNKNKIQTIIDKNSINKINKYYEIDFKLYKNI